MNLHKLYRTQFSKYYVDTKIRICHFLSQIGHESGFVLQRENLYYTTIAAARNAFKTPFKGKTDAFVSQYLRNPEKMANYVYANRMGNGNEASGDGWKFRGGGYLHNTGRNEYQRLTDRTGIDFVGRPNLILEEANAVIAALLYWHDAKLNAYADKDDIDSISDIINIGRKTKAYGDANGFAHRKVLLDNFKRTITI